MQTIISFLSLFFYFSACSIKGSNSGTSTNFNTINDAIPTGTLVIQGIFTGYNGQTASGTAQIYANNGAITLRLGNLSVPKETGLQVRLFSATSATPICIATLVHYTGNKNYTCPSIATGTTFTTVSIYSTLTQFDYAIAQLY